MSKPKHLSRSWIFGLHTVEFALQTHPESVLALWVQAGRHDQRLTRIIGLAEHAGIAVQTVERAHLDKRVSADARHQGVIAQVKNVPARQESDLDAIVERSGSALLLLILDGVQDPHNLGACLRTANAAGVQAVIAPRDNAAALTPVARKVASGAAEVTPFIQVSNLGRCLKHLQSQGVWIIGTSGDADQNVFRTDFNRPVAFVMGAEGGGLRRLTRELCDELVSIPMAGQVESLNVSVAAGVCLYAVLQQRKYKG
ncbi:MAG TPA: 23S rRNA (guanosine(2251)-2'-O)-methyltransferase RlmB [Gammaproteobacteria bacterium]